MKRAAIYVRTSTERQAEKASPAEQEADCRKLCEQRGHTVVAVYKDTEKYRVRGRLVECSGTRSDRPQFNRMLRDYDQGDFDVLVVWRSDRLYRGVNRAVIELKERVKQDGLVVEVVNGGFDAGTMEVLAWSAGVENEARLERTAMGIDARLRSGRLYVSHAPYGYDYDAQNGTLVVNEEEAKWVRAIWEWFAAGVGKGEIRRRLIEANVPQKSSADKKRLRPWSLPAIGNILRKDFYATGLWVRKAGKGKDTQEYEFSIPTIVASRTFEAARERQGQWKLHPAGNWKKNAGLLAGKVVCVHCGVKMGLTRKVSHGKQHNYYLCNNRKRRILNDTCAKYIRADSVDHAVWLMLWSYLADPLRLAQAALVRSLELSPDEKSAETEIMRLERELGDSLQERQKVVSWARKGIITDGDLETQLLILSEQEKNLRRDLQERKFAKAVTFDDLKKAVRALTEISAADLSFIHPDFKPTSERDIHDQFAARRKYIESLVSKVEVSQNGDIEVEFNLVWCGDMLVPVDKVDDMVLVELPISYMQPGSHVTDKQRISFAVKVPRL